MIDKQRFNRDNYKYIYDCKFANYLMLQDIVCKGTGVSKETGSYFWCFNRDEIQPIYDRIAFKKKHLDELEKHWDKAEENDIENLKLVW